MNHPEEFTKMTPNHIVKWVLKERQQFASEVEQNIDDNNDFLRIDPKMSMILILWSSEHLVVHPWLQSHHH